MKKLFSLFLVFAVTAAGFTAFAQMPPDENYGNNDGEVNYQTFYDQLQPYGNWIDYPGVGYVWQPNEGPSFRPYETNGHWVSTVDGWAWASNYNWGWAPFHYGRWLYEPAIGWAWVPGYEWAPAWVTWGQYGDDYAWAPLAPGISISIGSTWRAPYNYWSFIPRNYINYSNPSQYIVRNRFNQTVVSNITIINNYNSYNNRDFYHRGPDFHEVERYTHRTISPLAITTSQRPGAGRIDQRHFQVYRPAVLPNGAGGNRNYAPTRSRTIDEVRANGDSRRPGQELILIEVMRRMALIKTMQITLVCLIETKEEMEIIGMAILTAIRAILLIVLSLQIQIHPQPILIGGQADIKEITDKIIQVILLIILSLQLQIQPQPILIGGQADISEITDRIIPVILLIILSLQIQIQPQPILTGGQADIKEITGRIIRTEP